MPILASLAAVALFGSACFGAAPTGWSAAQPDRTTVFASMASGRVVAADAANGQRKWDYPPENNLGMPYYPPGVGADLIVVPNTHNNVAKVLGIRASDGQRLWEQDIRNAANLPVLPKSAILVTSNTAYVGAADGTLVALDISNGAPRSGFSFKAGDAIWGQPVLRDGALYVTSMDHRLYALDPESGQVRRTFTANGAIPGSVAFGRLLYVSSLDDTVYALDPTTLEQRWATKTGGWVWSEPLVDGETLYVGSFDRKLYALDAGTGETRWTAQLGGRIRPKPVLAADLVIAGADDGKIYALNRSGQQEWAHNAGGAVVSPLTAEGDIVYASDSSSHRIFALDARARSVRWELPSNR
ncbi:MAG: PQQ-binding-like beta-propeller repeat protein [Dehalococcoidia bacterium]